MAGYIAVIKSRGEAWLEGISRKCGGVGTAFPEAPRKDLPMTHNDLDVFANFINNNKSSSSHLERHHCYLETCFTVLTCIITIYTLTRSIYHKVVLYSTRLFFPHDRFFFQYVLLCHIAYHVKKFTAYERDGLLRWLDPTPNLHSRILDF